MEHTPGKPVTTPAVLDAQTAEQLAATLQVLATPSRRMILSRYGKAPARQSSWPTRWAWSSPHAPTRCGCSVPWDWSPDTGRDSA